MVHEFESPKMVHEFQNLIHEKWFTNFNLPYAAGGYFRGVLARLRSLDVPRQIA